MTQAPTNPAAILEAIICEVNGHRYTLARPLANAILAHPDSQWGPALPAPTDAELEANFRAWFKDAYGTDYFGGISLCDAIAWGKCLLQQSPQPAAPWPELPENPPNAEYDNIWQDDGYKDGWHAARVELQRLREQAGVAPTPAPAFPDISNQLIKSLIVDILALAGRATEESCLDCYWNPVPEVRARLYEILQLAAQDKAAKRPAL